jgi:hypothetical protein
MKSQAFRLLQNLALIIYLCITLSAFVFTLSRVRVPGVPHTLLHWAYGMMAPYQGDTDWNGAMYVTAQLPDGTWQEVDTSPFMPFEFGERNVREFFRVFVAPTPVEGQRSAFTEYALQLLDRERESGKEYQSLRIYFDQWERSPAGFTFLRHEPFVHRQLVTRVE